MPIALKYALTAAVVVAAAELAKKSDRIGALVAAMPMVTILAMIWLHVDRVGAEKIGNHASYTFWYVIPTLPMFLAIGPMLDRGMNFWVVLGSYILGTAVLVLATAAIAKRFGIYLL